MNLKIYEITYGETILESGDAASRIVTYDTVFSNQGAEGPVGPPGPQGIQGLPGDFVVNFRVVSAAETLISKAKIAANTTSGALTLTLPANPTNGDVIDFYDYAETFDTNNLTIARNGSRIEGLEENLVCNVKGAYFSLVYSGSTRGWQVLPSFGTSGGGGETVLTTQGDTLYRGLGVNQRLAIGSPGQILKVNSGGNAPEWGAAPATGVTSVALSSTDLTVSGSPVTSSGTITANLTNSGVSAGTYSKVTVDAKGRVTTGATAGIADVTGLQTALDAKQPSGSYAASVHTHAISDVTGLQTALDGKQASGNYATLVSGKVPSDQLPSFVDDVVEYANLAAFPVTGESGKIYVAIDTRKTYRWSGSAYVEISPSEVTSVAGRTGAVTLAVADVSDAVPTSRSISAGTGLTGGGDLTANRTLTVAYGTTSGTACQGNDSRLSDSRTPTSHAASHAAAGSDPVFNQNLNTTDAVEFGTVVITGTLDASQAGSTFLAPITTSVALVDAASTFSGTLRTDNDSLTANRTYDLPDASGTLALAGDAPASHTHGNLTNDGKVGSTSGLPLVTTTAGAVTTLALGTANQVLRVNSGASGVEFADPAAAGVTSVTGTAPIVSSGGTTPAISVTVGTGANTVAAGDDSRITGAIQSTLVDAKGDLIVATAADTVARLPVGATNGHVLTVDSAEAGGMKWAAAASGGVTAVGASTADVLSVSGSNLVADDGGLIDSSDPFIKWDDAAGKLVYANPLSRPTGSFYVGLAPTTTAIGSNAINIQSNRGAATRVASGANSICIGAHGATGSGSIAIGANDAVSGANSVGILGYTSRTSTVSIMGASYGSSDSSVLVGSGSQATGNRSVAIGANVIVSGPEAVAITPSSTSPTANLERMFQTWPHSAVYWTGTTSNNTAAILYLGGNVAGASRFTIAASSVYAVDVLLVARSVSIGKYLIARRYLGIRRDASNSTSLVGTVETIGTDKTEGSPSWTFTLTANDTAEALELTVTGATGETVTWAACAFWRNI